MPGETTAWGQKPALHWTPHLIKRLRGKRTQTEFGALLGAPKNTVWRWEAGQAHPPPPSDANTPPGCFR